MKEGALAWLSDLDHSVVIFDLEYTSWQGARERNWNGRGEYKEIVEIGAVSLDASRDFAEIASFSTLVMPRRNPVLSDYFVDLTGITQDELVRHGVDYAQARALFLTFLEPALIHGGKRIWSYGEDAGILLENDALCGLPPLFDIGCALDIRQDLAVAGGFDAKRTDTSAIPEALGLHSSARKHRARDDARTIGQVIRFLLDRERLTECVPEIDGDLGPASAP